MEFSNISEIFSQNNFTQKKSVVELYIPPRKDSRIFRYPAPPASDLPSDPVKFFK